MKYNDERTKPLIEKIQDYLERNKDSFPTPCFIYDLSEKISLSCLRGYENSKSSQRKSVSVRDSLMERLNYEKIQSGKRRKGYLIAAEELCTECEKYGKLLDTLREFAVRTLREIANREFEKNEFS